MRNYARRRKPKETRNLKYVFDQSELRFFLGKKARVDDPPDKFRRGRAIVRELFFLKYLVVIVSQPNSLPIKKGARIRLTGLALDGMVYEAL